MHRPARLRLVIGFGLALASAAPSHAQPYARFAVADSLLPAAIQASGAQYEASWNALLVSALRARLAKADSAARLDALARRVAAFETPALGSRIATDALGLRSRWSESAQRRRVHAAVAESLGAARLASRDFAQAESLYFAALEDYRALSEKRREAWVLGSLGVVNFQAGDYEHADSLYRHALTARRALGDPRMIGATLNALGSTNFQRGRSADAYAFFQQARAIRERTGERAALGQTLNYLGLASAALGRPDSARVFFREALALTVAQGDSARTESVLNNLAQQLVRDGRLEEAMPLWHRALAITRSLGDTQEEAHVEFGLGSVLRLQGRYAESAERLERARALSAEARDAHSELEASLELGLIWVELQDARSAREPLERALALAEARQDQDAKSRALNNLGIVARLEGDPTGARLLLERARAVAESTGAATLEHDALASLGVLALERGDPSDAASWFGRAGGLSTDMAVEVRIRDAVNLASADALRGHADAAEKGFQRALTMANDAGTPENAWAALIGLGDVAERRGDYPAALRNDRLAASLIDTLRSRQGGQQPSIVLLSRRLFAFEALIHLLGKRDAASPESGYAAEAFTWAERARARAFLDLISSSGHRAEPARPIGLAAARDLLSSEREALLEYSVGDSSSTLWAITRRGWKRFTLPPRAVLEARAEILRRALASPQTADARTARNAARSLYRSLIEPAEPMLKGVTHLIVAPDGALARIPFEALLAREAPEGKPVARGAWLVERFAVSYAASASALAARLSRAGSTSGPIVALGAAHFGNAPPPGHVAPLDSLPHTADEVSALAAASGGAIVTLTGDFATRTRLLALPALHEASLIHIATHGEANEAEPEHSGLWLAEENGIPGFLRLGDILGIPLDASLVTLSACETGYGRLERGEGVIGLSRAFLAAGARSVVVSLWKVNDRSTALLMQQFYGPLLQKRAPAAVALAAAKRALLANPETRSPFYWAPFVLVGASGPIR
jgi:CHAT domain-containing protein/Tfp pilus assembly protein PilF